MLELVKRADCTLDLHFLTEWKTTTPLTALILKWIHLTMGEKKLASFSATIFHFSSERERERTKEPEVNRLQWFELSNLTSLQWDLFLRHHVIRNGGAGPFSQFANGLFRPEFDGSNFELFIKIRNSHKWRKDDNSILYIAKWNYYRFIYVI